MIQANELRLNNYVYHKKQIEKVYSINTFNSSVSFYRGKTKKGVITQSYLSSGLQPIPLTEEILLKCGFKFKDKGFTDLSVSYGLATEQIHFVIGNYYQKITYLHQLQNLYFALTGQELEINL